jgi:hypothetical protein
MKGKNSLRRIGSLVLAASILFGVAIMPSTAVQAQWRGGGFHGGFRGRRFHGGGFRPRIFIGPSFGYPYPYRYRYYRYPYGYYGYPYGPYRYPW